MNVAVIGAGMMGANHARIYSQMRNVNLTGICDVDSQKAQRIATLYRTCAFTDYHQLIKKNKLHAVSIAVPTAFHKEVAIAFIKQRIPLLLEKPIAATVREAKEIIAAAKMYQTLVLVGHVERYNPAVVALQRLLATGKYGDILSVVIKRIGLYPPRIKDSNVITDLAVHDLDIIHNLIGKLPASIVASGGKTLNRNVEDHAEIFLDFESFGCFLQVNWITPIKVRTLSVNCSKGYLELNYITQKLTAYENNYLPTQEGGFTEFVSRLGEPPRKEVKVKNGEPLVLEIANFLSSVRGSEKIRVTTDDALRALQLSELVLKSIQNHTLVPVKRL
jgi:UDP-N-acetylglucosamine 3-dehydrogenase